MGVKFGTDGWRAEIAKEFTFDNVELCARAVAQYVREAGGGDRGIIVGYDTRFASAEFAACAADSVASSGVVAYLCDSAAPTPAVSYNVPARGAAGAIVITASHNPPLWNGVKYKPEYGGSASAEVVAALEKQVASLERDGASTPAGPSVAREARTIAVAPRYLRRLAELVDLDAIRQSGVSILVDAMHGAGAGYLPALLEGAVGPVVEARGERNPAFPGMRQPEPIGENLQPTAEMLRQCGADVGIAYDGDADRLGVLDETGRYLNTLQVFALLAYYLLEYKAVRGTIVKSVTSSDMLFRLGELYSAPVLETGVGFKHLGPRFMESDAIIAGEESGGYAFRGHIPERDGILSSLLLLEFIAKTGKKPSELMAELRDKVGDWSYLRRDVSFPDSDRAAIERRLAMLSGRGSIGRYETLSSDTIDGMRLRVRGGWLMARFSGTEPLLRVYAEAQSDEMANNLADAAMEKLGL